MKISDESPSIVCNNYYQQRFIILFISSETYDPLTTAVVRRILVPVNHDDPRYGVVEDIFSFRLLRHMAKSI